MNGPLRNLLSACKAVIASADRDGKKDEATETVTIKMSYGVLGLLRDAIAEGEATLSEKEN
jgi:hypothetical protein